MANPEREIKDMDELIDNLEDVSQALDGVVDSNMVKALDKVIDEWRGHTKGCIEELAEAADL